MQGNGAGQSELTRQSLAAAAESVLETMFFTSAEAVAVADGLASPWAGPTVAAELQFNGPFSGRFQLDLEATCASELAANALGDQETLAEGNRQVGYLACEMANMLCGNTLNQLDPVAVFDLTTPRLMPGLTPGLGEGASTVGRDAAEARRAEVLWLQTDSGLLRLCFELSCG
jgi:CheY-specific phosphatase CheX